MLKKVVAILLVFAFISGLIITNPSESRYLDRIATDYGSNHNGRIIAVEQLQDMGDGIRTSYGLFSIYRYEFGNVGVTYLGLATFIIQTGSYSKEPTRRQQNLQA